ncbi:hypothetical protein EC973_002251 [Apophysomyces ossiformis]|uniref:pH-response regulator protein palC n=1 Tax=Apophysomyces ossiformis TaxID=679940 RepID=A0A8H7BXY4_9FUNG|nr:hypothetical protein EC973_002251 [Apophysomyces ossiformis]
MSYPYSLPTTGTISFVDFLDNTGRYSAEISDATAQRGRIRTVLKGLKKEAQESRDYRLITNTIEDYLPYLISIVNCLEHGELKLQKQKNIETSWRSTLSDHLIHTGSNAPRIMCSDIHYELIFVLMTYAYACSLQSNDILKSVQHDSASASMQYKKACIISEKRTKEIACMIMMMRTLKAADALNTAAGVFQYVANEVIPKWRQPSSNRPVETIKELSTALSKMALADAQSIAISNALLDSKFSNSLIAKLYIGVAGQYEMSYGLISSISNGQEVSSDLKKYLSDGSQFYMAMAKKHLALDAYDNNKIGEALGFLRDCKADLRIVQHAGLSKPHIRKSAVAARACKEEETVNELLQRYTNFNDKVLGDNSTAISSLLIYPYLKFACQRVPSRQDLQRLIPNGRGVLELKRFTLPPPMFGPRNEDHSESQTARYAREGSYF